MFSDPVFGKDFFDRQEIIQLLQKRLCSFEKGYRQNVALLGGPMVGKTSILYELLHRWESTRINPFYFEIRDESLASFAERFMTSFLCRTPQQKNKESPKQVHIYQEAKTLMDQGHVQKGFTRLLDLIDLHVQETGRPCLMILDEFHLLENILGPETFSVFGKKILIQKQVMYLLASSAVAQSRDILQTKLNLLFGQFEIVPVEPFSMATADDFLKKRTGDLLPKEYRAFLTVVTNGSPFYLDVLMRPLAKTSFPDPGKAVVESFKTTLMVSPGILSQYFHSLLSQLRDSHLPVRARTQTGGTQTGKPETLDSKGLKILLAVADKKRRVGEIASHSSLSKAVVQKNLKRFIEKNSVKKMGGFYWLPDLLFCFWLKSVYGVRTFSSGADFEHREKVFEKNVLNWISDFINENNQKIHLRISSLLTSFDNHLIEFKNKWVRLPRFQKTDVELNGAIPHVIGYLPNSQKWKWIIYSDPVGEEDVSALASRRSRGLAFRPASRQGGGNRGLAGGGKEEDQRKIIVALRGIDSNATLLAKELKLWALDLDDLNQLLETYGQQKVIL